MEIVNDFVFLVALVCVVGTPVIISAGAIAYLLNSRLPKDWPN